MNNLIDSASYLFDTLGVYGNYLAFVLIVAIWFLMGRIVYKIIASLIKRSNGNTKSVVILAVLDAIEKPIVLLIFTIGLWIAIVYTNFFSPETNEILFKIIKLIILIDVSYLASSVLSRGIASYLEGKRFREETEIEKALPAIGKILNIIIVVIFIVFAFEIFGFNVASIVAGLGIGGLAVAFAARDTIANIFTSIAIVSDKTLRIGDRVKFDQYQGIVKEISLRSTKMETDYGSEVFIPNNKFGNFAVENFSNHNRRFTGEVIVKISNDTNSQKLKKLMESIDLVLNSCENSIQGGRAVISSISGSGIEILINYEYSNRKKPVLVRQELLLEIKQLLDKKKIILA